jgi:hypothetical protein
MRLSLVVLAVLLSAVGACAQKDKGKDTPAKRFAIEADLETYPQDTPQEALDSVIKAIEAKKIDYLLAQLADPDWVDGRVKNHGSFEDLVKDSTDYLAKDPALVKQLKLLRKGTWDVKGTRATASFKGENGKGGKEKESTENQVFFRKIGKWWYMENRTREAEKP